MAFEAKIEQTRRDIDQHYTRLIDTLQIRRQEMLDALDTLKNWLRFVHYKTEILLQALARAENNIEIPIAARQATVNEFTTEIDRLNVLKESMRVEFGWERSQLEKAKFGLMVYVNRQETVDIMELRVKHRFDVIAFGNKGNKEGELNHPEGVAVEPVKDWILVANCENNSIDIFSKEGKFLNRFGGINELQGPNGITTYNQEIYVSNLKSHCITVHSFIRGRMLRQMGGKGKGNLEFSNPEGICIAATPNGCLVYVADRDNNRVKVLNGDLKFQKHIGAGQVNQPRDVKVFETEVYVLDGSMDACIKVFNNAGQRVRQFLTQDKEVKKPRYFEIDYSGNLLISDKGNNSIVIYRENGVSTRFGGAGDGVGGFRMPTGIAISMEGRIVVVDGKKENDVVQVFDDVILKHFWSQ